MFWGGAVKMTRYGDGGGALCADPFIDPSTTLDALSIIQEGFKKNLKIGPQPGPTTLWSA
jgi:hypothetical protein